MTTLVVTWVLGPAAVFSAPTDDHELKVERIQKRFNWIPLVRVADTDRDSRCLKCKGQYQDPLAEVDRSVSPNELDLEVSAGDSDITDSKFLFSGDVRVTQGYRTVKAQEVYIDRV